MKITIYTTPACPYCQQAMDYFRDKKLPFEEIDVSRDQKKAEEMVKLCMPKGGHMGVPVIKIDDEIIVGFDRSEVEKALKEK